MTDDEILKEIFISNQYDYFDDSDIYEFFPVLITEVGGEVVSNKEQTIDDYNFVSTLSFKLDGEVYNYSTVFQST